MNVTPLMTSINSESFLKDYLKKFNILDVQWYLRPDCACFESWEDFPRIKEATELLHKHLLGKIGILCDSDCDGYLSSSMLTHFLVNFLHTTPIVFFHTGKQHGLTQSNEEDIVQQVIDAKIDLLIIPDAGSNNPAECHTLKQQGIDILILDHHPVDEETEDAIIINPHLTSNYNHDLSGTGVVYKFIVEYCRHYHMSMDSYFDMVAVSIISDSCNLCSIENRAFIYYGLSGFRNHMLKLMAEKLNKRGNTPNGCAFGLIPPINALCRGDNQEAKKEFFDALSGQGDIEKGLYWARKAHREQTAQVKEIQERVQETIDTSHNVTVGFAEKEDKSYIGLVANKFMSQYSKPTIILRELNPTVWTGSLRSPIPMESRINETGLAKCQGHEFACGCTVKKSNFDRLIEWFDSLDLSIQPDIAVTAILNPSQVSLALCMCCEHWKILWGQGLPEPTFYLKLPMDPNNTVIYKKKTNTLKITVGEVNFIKFFVSDEEVEKIEEARDNMATMEVVVKLSTNSWNNMTYPQAEIVKYEIVNKVPQENNWESVF